MRIFFTGGSGKAGRHVIPYLLERGHRVTNADLVPLDAPGVDNLTVDITDAGQLFSALTSYAGFDELEPGTGIPRYDAVVHFAAIPRILMRPDTETFRVNAVGTFNVLEAATKTGIRKIVTASSETVYGICFADGERRPAYLPVDEDHPTVPEDAYAMSKVAGEVAARSFQARTGADIYALRINNVIEPHEYARDFPRYFADPELRRRNIFAYIDARDLGPDRRPLPGRRRARLAGLQRRQRRALGAPDHRRDRPALVRGRRAAARDGPIREPVFQRAHPQVARLSGAPPVVAGGAGPAGRARLNGRHSAAPRPHRRPDGDNEPRVPAGRTSTPPTTRPRCARPSGSSGADIRASTGGTRWGDSRARTPTSAPASCSVFRSATHGGGRYRTRRASAAEGATIRVAGATSSPGRRQLTSRSQ